MPRKLVLCIVSSVLLFLSWQSSANASVRVLTSIQPLAMIARAIAGDEATVDVLIEGHDSAHHFTLSPSDRLAVENADMLLWIGEEFEVFLETMMGQLREQELITALDLPELTVWPLDAQTVDSHIWLDPHNALIIAGALAEELARKDTANAERYRDNLTAFTTRLTAAQENISAQLGQLPAFSFAVYHNAYQYFEQRFGLAHGVALLDNPEVAPGIQQTLRVQQRVRELNPSCVLIEPDYSPALLATLLDGIEVEEIHLDPLGYHLEDSANNLTTAAAAAESYVHLLQSIAEGMQRCASAD